VSVLAAALCFGFPALAQTPASADQLRDEIRQLRARLDQLEAALAAQPGARAPAPTVTRRARPAPTTTPPVSARAEATAAAQAAREARAASEEARAALRTAQEARDAVRAVTQATAPVQGLDAPDEMGRPDFVTEDALRPDLPGIAFRVPGTDTQVRLYGFAKVTTWQDINGRNQSDAPPPSQIPLTNSPADLQGGEYGISARFSRFGLDTRTLTRWGTLETRIEGDFGGGPALSNNAVLRLRQAWAELGRPEFRVLAGFANSLWNEGLYETIIDATNLNQSFVRQAQLRVSGRLIPGRSGGPTDGLYGQLSIETPETNYAAVDGLVNPSSTLAGGASPAFNAMPDFLGRLSYRDAGWEFVLRGLLRNLRIETAGTSFAPPAQDVNATAWGFAGHVRMPMRVLSDRLPFDEVVGAVYYGEGVGRYFFGSSGGIDAISNLGLPGVAAASLNPVPTWGLTAAYRRFWAPQWRSNFSYAWSRQDFPGYARDFVPGSASAIALNRELQQVFANLIWSPFAEESGGRVNTGWLDLGLEYLFTRRDIFNGSLASGPAVAGHGIANRLLFGVVARF
jgi:hypothetical protein